jgi:hypothetical protein
MNKLEKARHDVPMVPESYEGTRMDPGDGTDPPLLTHKGRPRPYKEVLLARRTLSPTRALS